MANSSEFLEYLHELFDPLGAISIRAMFGGHGVYHNGIMFALVADNALYLKVDANNKPDYEAQGLQPFVYSGKNSKTATMSYYQAPDEGLENARALYPWAMKAYEAGRRASLSKPVKKRAPTKSISPKKTTKKKVSKKKASKKKKAQKKKTVKKKST